MQVTNEGYILTRNVMKVDIKKNRFLKFIRNHKISIIVSIIFIGLILTEGVLLNSFIKLLLIL